MPNESHRHDVRPGLTGLAQVNGRSFLTWEEIFAYDVKYARNITLLSDIQIVVKTVFKVLKRESIADVAVSHVEKDGKLHFNIDGKDVVLHQPLYVERGRV